MISYLDKYYGHFVSNTPLDSRTAIATVWSISFGQPSISVFLGKKLIYSHEIDFNIVYYSSAETIIF